MHTRSFVCLVTLDRPTPPAPPNTPNKHNTNTTRKKGLLGSPLEVAWDLGALAGTPCDKLLPPTSKGAHVPLWLNVALSLVAPDCVIHLMNVHYDNATQQCVVFFVGGILLG
jgi:hypothetical protein